MLTSVHVALNPCCPTALSASMKLKEETKEKATTVISMFFFHCAWIVFVAYEKYIETNWAKWGERERERNEPKAHVVILGKINPFDFRCFNATELDGRRRCGVPHA